MKEINSKKREINSILRQNTFYEKLYDIEKIKGQRKRCAYCFKNGIRSETNYQNSFEECKKEFHPECLLKVAPLGL